MRIEHPFDVSCTFIYFYLKEKLFLSNIRYSTNSVLPPQIKAWHGWKKKLVSLLLKLIRWPTTNGNLKKNWVSHHDRILYINVILFSVENDAVFNKTLLSMTFCYFTKKNVLGPILTDFCQFHYYFHYFGFIEWVHCIKNKYSGKKFHCFKFKDDKRLKAINMKFKLLPNIFSW